MNARELRSLGIQLEHKLHLLSQSRKALRDALTNIEDAERLTSEEHATVACQFQTEGGSPCQKGLGRPALVFKVVASIPCCEDHARIRTRSIRG